MLGYLTCGVPLITVFSSFFFSKIQALRRNLSIFLCLMHMSCWQAQSHKRTVGIFMWLYVCVCGCFSLRLQMRFAAFGACVGQASPHRLLFALLAHFSSCLTSAREGTEGTQGRKDARTSVEDCNRAMATASSLFVCSSCLPTAAYLSLAKLHARLVPSLHVLLRSATYWTSLCYCCIIFQMAYL